MTYGKIGNLRLLDIRVVNENNEILYEGLVENAPNEIKELNYKAFDGGNMCILLV